MTLVAHIESQRPGCYLQVQARSKTLQESAKTSIHPPCISYKCRAASVLQHSPGDNGGALFT